MEISRSQDVNQSSLGDNPANDFYNQLKQKLEVNLTSCQMPLDQLSTIKFNFAKQSSLERLDPIHRLRFNYEPNIPRIAMVVKKSNVSEENIKILPKLQPIPALDKVFFGDYIGDEQRAASSDITGSTDDFIIQQFSKCQESDIDGKNDPSKSPVAISKLTDSESMTFFQSLEENLQQIKEDRYIPRLQTPSLSASAKRLRQKKLLTAADYSKVLKEIVKSETTTEAVTKVQDSDEDMLKVLFKENAPPNLHQKKIKRITFKDQVASTSNKIQQPPAKPQQNHISSKALDGFDLLANKFKLDLLKPSLKQPNLNKSINSIFNSSNTFNNKVKLQLKTSNIRVPPNEISKDDKREEMLKKSKKDLQIHKDVSKYYDELCRIKFNDL